MFQLRRHLKRGSGWGSRSDPGRKGTETGTRLRGRGMSSGAEECSCVNPGAMPIQHTGNGRGKKVEPGVILGLDMALVTIFGKRVQTRSPGSSPGPRITDTTIPLFHYSTLLIPTAPIFQHKFFI